MQYWLVKTDPDTYSFDDFVRDKSTHWDGVRNYEARNNLMKMKKGDEVLFYHSQTDKNVLGIATVKKEFFEDTTTDDKRWVAVELKFKNKFSKPVSLETIKNDKILSNIALVRQSRLSVMPLTQAEFDRIVLLSK